MTIVPRSPLGGTLEFLERRRQAKRISYAEMARRGGYTDASHAKRQLDPSSNPTLKSVLRAAEALGVELEVTVPRRRGAHRITFLNHAGGVGKTTVTREIGTQLALYGQRVLLVDVDPQSNLTEWMGFPFDSVTLEDTIYPSIVPSNPGMMNNLAPLPIPKRAFDLVDLIPAVEDMVMLEAGIQQQMGAGLLRLRQALDRLEEETEYDFILIDPPPYISQVTSLATLAVDNVIIPTSTDPKGVRGIQRLITYIDTLRPQNPNLDIRMILPTMYAERTVNSRMTLELLHQQHEQKVLPTITPPLRQRVGYTTATATFTPAVLSNERNAQAIKPDVEQVTDAILTEFGVELAVPAETEAGAGVA